MAILYSIFRLNGGCAEEAQHYFWKKANYNTNICTIVRVSGVYLSNWPKLSVKIKLILNIGKNYLIYLI